MPLTMAVSPSTISSAKWRGPETCADSPQRVSFPISDYGDPIVQIVNRVDDLALRYGNSPCVLTFARSLIRDIQTNNYRREHFNRIANIVLEKTVYVADPRGVEYVRSPVRMIMDINKQGYAQGDCDDCVLLANSLYNALGFDTRVVAVTLKGSDYPNHVLSQIKFAGAWVWFDPCNKSNPRQVWSGNMIFSK